MSKNLVNDNMLVANRAQLITTDAWHDLNILDREHTHADIYIAGRYYLIIIIT